MCFSNELLLFHEFRKDIFGYVPMLARVTVGYQLVFPIVGVGAPLDGAFVRFFLVVSSLVIISIADCSKPLVAMTTLIWLDAGVHPIMNLREAVRIVGSHLPRDFHAR